MLLDPYQVKSGYGFIEHMDEDVNDGSEAQI